MKRRLFLTGPIGCGKSTAITLGLGGRRDRLKGFVTVREGQTPKPERFWLGTLPKGKRAVFLDLTGEKPQIDLRVFSGLGVQSLQKGPLLLEQYRTTQMFDSAKIGLEYLKDKCDGILFTPVDIPLFTASTVSALMDCGARLVCPVCEGRRGHPILIGTELVDTILAYCGEGGLGGAIEHCGVEMTEIAVEDSGILHDADTPEDYRALLSYHNRQLVRPIINVELAKEKVFFYRKIAMLLTLVEETNSVRSACQRMQISHSTGWNIIRRLETELGRTLVERSQGGLGGGQSRLTGDGLRLLEKYNEFERQLREEGDRLFQDCFGELL